MQDVDPQSLPPWARTLGEGLRLVVLVAGFLIVIARISAWAGSSYQQFSTLQALLERMNLKVDDLMVSRMDHEARLRFIEHELDRAMRSPQSNP